MHVCVGEGGKVTRLTSKSHREGAEQSTVGLPGVFDASVTTAPQTEPAAALVKFTPNLSENREDSGNALGFLKPGVRPSTKRSHKVFLS